MRDSRLDSPYARLNYRRLIAWPARIEREGPFLERQLALAPQPSVIDLGCGTGEHAHHLASRGFRTVGVDRSATLIAEAREYQGEFPPYGPDFVCGDLTQLAVLTDEQFGAAICLGNVLPHLEDAALEVTLEAVASRLHGNGRLVLQIINYERIFTRDERHMPLNFRTHPERPADEIVFLRLMKRDGARHVKFFPSTLALCPGEEPPLTIEATKEIRLRAWRLAELEAALAKRGFSIDGAYGDMSSTAFDAEDSTDLILTATLDTKTSARAAGERGGLGDED